MTSLFDPCTIGDLSLPNRIIMAPLTRTRSTRERMATPLMAEYYAQRATAGLIICEATSVEPMGVGMNWTPGIWAAEHIESWREVTAAVHKAGGQILMQLWHVGRLSDPLFLDGKAPIAPSAIAAPGSATSVRPKKPYDTPRPLETSEIPALIESFRQAALNAKDAGFDGVFLHSGNGYMVEQFLTDRSNTRDDDYGGDIPRRARLMLEITDALISVWGPGRVGVHMSPRPGGQSVGDSDPVALYTYLARELAARNIAFVFVREAEGEDALLPLIKKTFGGFCVANEGLTKETGQKLLDAGHADAVAYGRLIIANPDLVERFRTDAPLNPLVMQTIYTPGPVGYTDYSFMTSADSDSETSEQKEFADS